MRNACQRASIEAWLLEQRAKNYDSEGLSLGQFLLAPEVGFTLVDIGTHSVIDTALTSVFEWIVQAFLGKQRYDIAYSVRYFLESSTIEALALSFCYVELCVLVRRL
ncbi:hypothetical protein Tco_0529819 [Tanacetum coccineum]